MTCARTTSRPPSSRARSSLPGSTSMSRGQRQERWSSRGLFVTRSTALRLGSRSECERDRSARGAAGRARTGLVVGGLAPRAHRGVARSGRFGRTAGEGGRACGPTRRAGCDRPGAGACHRARPAQGTCLARRETRRHGIGVRRRRQGLAPLDRTPRRSSRRGRRADGRSGSRLGRGGLRRFAPTPEGYRLVEIPGVPPEIGSAITLDSCDGQLVVTRYGRSPLPLDGRPCAYLDRA